MAMGWVFSHRIRYGDIHQMAINAGSLIDIQLRYSLLNQQMMNVFSFHVFELVSTVDAIDYGEGWWNHVKTTTRALYSSGFGDVFRSVFVRELNNPTGEYAEFTVPVGERAGTRTPPTASNYMPPFTAAGVRFTVGSRTTRPGQKRLSCLVEEDNISGSLQSAMTALLNSWAGVATANHTLGAPAAGAVLVPIVTRRDAQGTVTAWQPVQGYVVNNLITSQNSRKVGRGN